MSHDGLRVLCWRADNAGDARRVAAVTRLQALFPAPVTLCFAGAPVDDATRAAAAGLVTIELAVTSGVAEADLVLALSPDEPGLAVPLPAVATLPPDTEAGAGIFGLTGEDDPVLGEALAFLALDPDLRRGLRAERQHCLAKPAPAGAWAVEGPFDSSFSLAIVNRELAGALDALGLPATLDGPAYRAGQTPNWSFLAARPQARRLFERGRAMTRREVMLANDYPPQAAALPRADRMLLANYAWEESGYPAHWVRAFNWRLDALTVCSPLTKKILRDAGVKRPIAVVGNGIEQLAEVTPVPLPLSLGTLGRFRFLHVSSCLPRKGVDVLLTAYGAAFTHSDPVTLVIKTFPNENNSVPTLLERLRGERADFPEVTLINADIPDGEMAWLYNQCQAFVLTPRAEGFGLPIAEAALHGLPSITTAFGGQRCFVDEATAFLVDYRFDRSSSHLGIADSLWVEPDPDDLARVLRTVAATSRPALTAMAERLRVRLLSAYRWPDVARRTRAAVAMLDHLPWLATQPRIAWVSTWNSRCGIATYSQHLAGSWPRERLLVFANRDAEPLGPDDAQVRRNWSRDVFDAPALAADIVTAGCRAAVIQHQPGLFSAQEAGHLARLLAEHGVRAYVALHNTAQLDDGARSLAAAHRLLVHTVADMNRLKALGLTERALLLPHGIYPAPGKIDGLRQRMGLARRRIIATFGFLMPHKGLGEVIEAFALLTQRHPDLHLLMLNALFPTAASSQEAERLKAMIVDHGLSRCITLVTDFLPDAEALALLASAELTVFAYQNTDESASGAIRMGIAAGRPILATPLPIFADTAEAVSFLPGTTPTEIATGITDEMARLADPGYRAAAAQRVADFASARQWPLLAERLLGMIDGNANDPFPDDLMP